MKKNGKNRSVKTTDKAQNIKSTHLCVDCSNCRPDLCKKVKAALFAKEEYMAARKSIEDFPFITKGVQLSEDGKILELHVEECSAFKPDPYRRANIKNIMNLKESIIMIYFNAGSLDEAKDIQERMQRSGQLRRP